MYDKTQTTGIFTAAQSGLQSSIQTLFSSNKDGVNQTTLSSAITSSTNTTNTTFLQMLSNQFSSLDKNNDGVLTSDEASQMVTDISSGLTRDQVLQLRAQGSIDEELANKIISNFSKMDSNGDGKVSETEINNFCMNEDIEDKQAEQKELTIKNMSLYYDTDDDDVSES